MDPIYTKQSKPTPNREIHEMRSCSFCVQVARLLYLGPMFSTFKSSFLSFWKPSIIKVRQFCRVSNFFAYLWVSTFSCRHWTLAGYRLQPAPSSINGHHYYQLSINNYKCLWDVTLSSELWWPRGLWPSQIRVSRKASRLFHLFCLFQVISGKQKILTLSACLSTYSKLSTCPTGHFLYDVNCALPFVRALFTVLPFGTPSVNFGVFVHSKCLFIQVQI